MTFEEAAQVAAILKAAYGDKADKIPKDEFSVRVWHEMLKDIGFENIKLAVQKWCATEYFPPSISDIRRTVAEIRTGKPPLWDEAWGNVVSLIGKYGYMRPLEAYKEMDTVTAECVRCIGWVQICTSDCIAAERAKFRDAYEARIRRKSEDAIMPESLKAIQGIAQGDKNEYLLHG